MSGSDRRAVAAGSTALPVLAPAAGWQKADEEDLLYKFLPDQLQAVTANLLTQADDDDSVGRLLRKSIRHWLH
ncbi:MULTISPECIES: hypothetical protein [Streptomyces]|uniref:Uncharacterized protein n=1 Tax=Streptomyces sudanensis TaxID=436397 RepID=A0ABY4TI29_9ACTN|nr:MULTISPECIES: hypothetical protein [Streptomyces]MCP9956063.1 hypothetical protein [Streptomyces sudanensis]MCQ0003254.1 hypothetical protein [Streptomyces sudanensis]URN18567.1 hypothetical protein MW084_24325 [Streptomyces sudanensis]